MRHYAKPAASQDHPIIKVQASSINGFDVTVAASAIVIATAKPGAQTDFVKSQGAQHVAEETGDLAAQVKAIAPNGVNANLHIAGDASALPNLLAVDGKLGKQSITL